MCADFPNMDPCFAPQIGDMEMGDHQGKSSRGLKKKGRKKWKQLSGGTLQARTKGKWWLPLVGQHTIYMVKK